MSSANIILQHWQPGYMLRGVFWWGGPVTYQFPVGIWHYVVAYVFVHTIWPIHSRSLLLLWSLWMEYSAKEMGWATTHYTPYYENYIAAVCNYPNKCLYYRGGSVQATMANYECYIVLSQLGSWWWFSWCGKFVVSPIKSYSGHSAIAVCSAR